MSEENPDLQGGVLETLKRLFTTFVEIIHNRLELLSLDIEENQQNLISLLILSFIAFFCIGIGIVLGIFLLVVLFWETHRLLVLLSLTILFLSIGISACLYAIYKVRTMPRLFSSSISELLKDIKHLDPKK